LGDICPQERRVSRRFGGQWRFSPGSRFGLDLFTVLGVEPVVDELVVAQLIDLTRQPEYVFHHPLIRMVAYESQLKSDRADLQRIAAAIESRDPAAAEENAALIAEHLLVGGS